MARRAEGHAVVDVVPAIRVRGPRLGVVDMQRAASIMASLARPVVTPEATVAVCDVGGVLEVGVAQRRVPASPVRMVRAAQVDFGRPDASSLDAPADGCLVRVRQRPTAKSGADVVALGLRRYPSRRRRLALPRRADLGPHVIATRWVVAEVRPGGPAGVRAEPLATGPVGGTALFAKSSNHKTEFTTWS